MTLAQLVCLLFHLARYSLVQLSRVLTVELGDYSTLSFLAVRSINLLPHVLLIQVINNPLVQLVSYSLFHLTC